MITLNNIADIIMANDNFEIITHVYPDGDTLGCGYALCLALQHLGKHATVVTAGVLPKKFLFLTEGVRQQTFQAEYVISVDIAAASLLGKNQERYENNINICIDHHSANSIKADHIYIDSNAAAACEIIYDLIQIMKVPVTDQIANCIYTGISTDTGCFRYSNTTSKTHMIAAELMKTDCSWHKINQTMFETKTKEFIQFERMVYDTMEFFAGGKGAIVNTTLAMQKQSNLSDDQIEGIASIPRQIEGVLMGITVREKGDGIYKVSVRTNEGVNASDFCGRFDGGGHAAAAGCSLTGTLQSVKERLIQEAELLL